MFFLGDATAISAMTGELTAYATAAGALVAAVIALKIGLKWAKGISSRAS